MKTKTLLDTLTEIERTLLRGDCGAAYALVLGAEVCVLEIERELIQLRSDTVRLSGLLHPDEVSKTRTRPVERGFEQKSIFRGSISDCRRFGNSSSAAHPLLMTGSS